MLKAGVLKRTLKSPPVPKSSALEAALVLELDAEEGAGTGTSGKGAGREVWRLALEVLEAEPLEEPDTAEDTVWETRGEISATT